MLTNLTVDVFCKEIKTDVPAYRLYVNGYLLTERTWIWPSYEVFVREHIQVNIDPGKHRVTAQSANNGLTLELKNLTINEKEHKYTAGMGQELAFET